MKRFLQIGAGAGLQPLFLGWFLFLLLYPTLLLLFGGTISWMERWPALLFPLSLYMLFFAAFRKPGIPFLFSFPLVVLGVFQGVLYLLFGESVITADMLLNLYTTHSGEAGEILYKIVPEVWGVASIVLLSLLLAFYSIRSPRILSMRLRCYMQGISAILLMLALFFIHRVKREHPDYAFWEEIYPINAVYNIGFAVGHIRQVDSYSKQIDKFRYQVRTTRPTTQRELVVLVIGETARAKNWGLFGYERSTTPLLQQEDLYLFCDVLAQSNVTHKSVPLLLSPASASDYALLNRRKSIISVYREAGYETAFLTNHTPNRSYIDCFASEADFYFNNRLGKQSLSMHDDALLPKLDSLLNTAWEKRFIVLHTYGSHFDYRCRYSTEEAYFLPDRTEKITKQYRQELVNAYDNTIRQTDRFLTQLLGQLKRHRDASIAMLYVSDHGEDLMDDARNRFLHASAVPTYYQLHVPLILWLSPQLQRLAPRYGKEASLHMYAPVTTAVVFHTLLDLSSISISDWDPAKSLVNSALLSEERFVLDDHNRARPIRLLLDSLDRAACERVAIREW